MSLRTPQDYTFSSQRLVLHLEQATLYFPQSMIQPTLLWWSCRTFVRSYTLEAPDSWRWTAPSLLNLRTTSLLQASALQPWNCAYLSWGFQVNHSLNFGQDSTLGIPAVLQRIGWRQSLKILITDSNLGRILHLGFLLSSGTHRLDYFYLLHKDINLTLHRKGVV